MTLVSAHRAGGGTGSSRAALAAAAGSGVDFVEIDVRRTRDGTFVIAHDRDVLRDGRPVPVARLTAEEAARLSGPAHLALEECLAVIAGRSGAHVDLKTSTPTAVAEEAGGEWDRYWEVQVVRRVLEVLGEGGTVVTSGNDASVASLRRWAEACGHPGLRVGLSLGRGVQGLGVRAAVRSLRSELFPGRRMRACGANLVVAQKELALLTVARWARRHRVPLLVWTVDTERQLAYWLSRERAWMVTTNRPVQALEILARRGGGKDARARQAESGAQGREPVE